MSELSTEYRTHTCGELRTKHAQAAGSGERPVVALCGHFDGKSGERGFLIRDAYGKTLVAVDERADPKVLDLFAELGVEDVVRVTGEAVLREKHLIDPKLATGKVFLKAKKLDLLSKSAPLPPGILSSAKVPLEDRTAFRPLYLRRPEMKERLEFRSQLAQEIREYLISQAFLEIETPHLFWYDRVALASEPVPVGGGRAFALPSGGLVLDQYIVAGQFERFFQFLRITRRELRTQTPMHAPEHTLLDVNMAYADSRDFESMVEGLIAHVFKRMLGIDLRTPFKGYTYAEAIEKFGTDKVDARFGLELEPTEGGRRFRVPGGAVKLDAEQLTALAAKAAPGARVSGERDGADFVVTVAGAEPAAAGAIRVAVARRLDLIDPKKHEPVWIRSYPFLTDDAGTLVPNVVVFSMPVGGDYADFAEAPEGTGREKVRAQAFDLVIDGVEVASAYMGNHDLTTQFMVWADIFKFTNPDLIRVRAPVESHRFGVPPHGGMNIGFDRLVALLLGLGAIDEAMFFPKTQDCRDPLLDAPGPVPLEFVKELTGEGPPAEPADRELLEETLKL